MENRDTKDKDKEYDERFYRLFTLSMGYSYFMMTLILTIKFGDTALSLFYIVAPFFITCLITFIFMKLNLSIEVEDDGSRY